MKTVITTLATVVLAAGAALLPAPAASARPANQVPDVPCEWLRPGVWGCWAVNPVPVYADGAHLTDPPFRYIPGGWFETNCKNDNGFYSGPGPHSHRWEYTTFLGAGGWVPDSRVYDETNPIAYCPPRLTTPSGGPLGS